MCSRESEATRSQRSSYDIDLVVAGTCVCVCLRLRRSKLVNLALTRASCRNVCVCFRSVCCGDCTFVSWTAKSVVDGWNTHDITPDVFGPRSDVFRPRGNHRIRRRLLEITVRGRMTFPVYPTLLSIVLPFLPISILLPSLLLAPKSSHEV